MKVGDMTVDLLRITSNSLRDVCS